MKRTLILFSKIFYKHSPPHGVHHPENPARLDVVLNAIYRENLYDRIKNIDALNPHYYQYRDKVHDQDYVRFIKNICTLEEESFIDIDTYVNKHSFDVATHAVGCSVYATELALDMSEFLILALVRPPGHHVGSKGRAMGAPTQGFCIFNNIAAGTAYALDKGFRPIVILDVDVHHGNGTQEIFWFNPDVIHIDIHEEGLYPGSGSIEDLGGGDAYGTKINIPLKPFSDDHDYMYIFEELVIPLIRIIKPRCIMVSAGFDIYEGELIGNMRVSSEFFRYLGSILRLISSELGIGISAVLEGGYSVGLDKGFPAFIKGFEQPEALTDKNKLRPAKYVLNLVKHVKALLREVHSF